MLQLEEEKDKQSQNHLLNQDNQNHYNPEISRRQTTPTIPITKEDELLSFKQMIGLTYENLNKGITEDLNGQIINLRSHVSKQYTEMNNMF